VAARTRRGGQLESRLAQWIFGGGRFLERGENIFPVADNFFVPQQFLSHN